jgi:LuxR family maltose regulon positive regulatory protein
MEVVSGLIQTGVFMAYRNLPAWGERGAGVRRWGDFREKGRILTPQRRVWLHDDPMPAPLLFRRRLINAIEEDGNQLIYIYGPAGYGKSALARQWAESQSKPTVWFEGSSSSNAAELLRLLISKITESVPALEPKLDGFEIPDSLTIEVLGRFLGILEKDKTLFNLVIDNAESIRKSHNEFSRFLVSQLPTNIRLVLVTQTSPSTGFIKESGLDRFTVISPTELKFDQEEISQLAKQTVEKISTRQITEILKLTEGWPAGVHIAISQLEYSIDIEEMLGSIKTKGRQQFAIASKRILSTLDSEDFELVSSLCLLEEIDSEAALTISGNLDAVRKLTILSQESMVVEQTWTTPPRFSINPILRSALVDELQRSENFTEKVESVLSHLLNKGEINSLTKVLLEVGALKRLADIVRDPNFTEKIDASIQDSVARGSVNELKNWVLVAKSVPGLGEGPALILNFYVEFLSGNLPAAETHLQSLRAFLKGTNGKVGMNVLPDIAIMDSIALFARGRLEESFDVAIEAWKRSAKNHEDTRHHQITYLQLALWGAVISDDDKKVQIISEILDSELMKKIANSRFTVVMGMRALIAAHEGRFTETRNQLVSPSSTANSVRSSGFFGPYGVVLAQSMLLGESGELETSVNILKEASDQALASSNFPMTVALLGRLSYHLQLLGRSQEALDVISKARQIVEVNSLGAVMTSAIDMWEARVRHLLPDTERVNELVARSRPTYLIRAFQAAIYINSNSDKAVAIMETFDLQIPKQQLTYHLFKAHLLQDSPIKQLEEVRKAVEVGAKHGYFNHFLTQRSDVIQAYISLAAEYPTSFNERLARAAGERLNEMMVGNSQGGESLTRREADILRHLATGLPIRDIANNLNISKNTIKTHLRNLYRKLGAEDRRDAVEKGKRLLKV